MSKELTTPLEALWKLYTYDDLKSRNPISYLLEQEKLPTYYKIIETALKRLEIIDRLNEKHCDDIQRKLKALEIINEKRVNVFILRYAFLHSEGLNFYNKHFGNEELQLTQEEFDLLKEVLK